MTTPPTYPLAPICLFVYKRLDTLIEVVKSLQKNELAELSDLFIFSDAAGKAADEAAVSDVRNFCKMITGFKSVTLSFAKKNSGLAASVIRGVSDVLGKSDKVIVLEDDLVVSSNFLVFMNKALHFYKDNKQMFSVSGYSSPIKNKKNQDVYFTRRGSCWGWGMWSDRWRTIDWNVADYESFSCDKKRQKKFNQMGSDLTGLLRKQRAGKINSWAIRWNYEQFKRNQYSVFPVVSKVSNEGFGDNSTHTAKSQRSRFYTTLDVSNTTYFSFPEYPFLDPYFIKQFTDKYSLATRVIYKLKSILTEPYSVKQLTEMFTSVTEAFYKNKAF